MTIDIAINGYGRIGPNVPCAFMKAGRVHDIEIVAINDLRDAETNARLMRYDTAHERCAGSVAVDDNHLVANGDRLEVFAKRNPSVVPRGALGVDFVLERTGRFTSNKIVSRTSCRRREKGRDLCARRQGCRRDDRLRGLDRMLNTTVALMHAR
jgi:glyceraldehyde-3-phosphate dehydrogenase/erythrose-4-phosphate dehydrogenase